MIILIICIILNIVYGVNAVDFVVVTDSTTSPEIAISRLAEQEEIPDLNLRKMYKEKPKIIRTVMIPSRKNRKTNRKEQRFGLVSNLEEPQIELLRNTPGVLYVVTNDIIEHSEISSVPTSQWNLDRIDQSIGQDGRYTYSKETGLGIDLYVLDSGVYGNHSCFGNRVQPGYDAFNNGRPTGNQDCNGHGTHVASTAAGVGYGVATDAIIYPVRVLGCNGAGNLLTLTSGVAWTIQNMENQIQRRPTVVNLSIQSPTNPVINSLMRDLHNAGAVVVVAAANYNDDACKYSPAGEPVAVSVGASSLDDSRASFSNYGTCVDLYAPGEGIIGAAITGPNAAIEKRGTSMASPLVAGIVATIQQRFPNLNNQEVIAELLQIAKPLPKNVIDQDCAGNLTGNLMLQTLSTLNHKGKDEVIEASGVSLKGDFKFWSSDLSFPLPDENGTSCLTFTSKVLDGPSPLQAPIQVAIATDIFPLGFTNFDKAICKDKSIRRYSVNYGANYAKVHSTNNVLLAASPRPVMTNDLLDSLSSLETSYFISLQQTSRGMSIRFGQGDGSMVDEQLATIVSLIDTNELTPVKKFTKISFSTGPQYVVQYSNIRSCSTSPTTSVYQKPTTSPTYVPSTSPNSEAPSTFPTITSSSPSGSPSRNPTNFPTLYPTKRPTKRTKKPTQYPTTSSPTSSPNAI